MFSERGIAEFKRTLDMATPPALVMFEMRDAVALPWRTAAITPVDGATVQAAGRVGVRVGGVGNGDGEGAERGVSTATFRSRAASWLTARR